MPNAAATKRPVQFWAVPIGTAAVKCRECPTMMFFVRTGSGRNMPIDCSVDGAAPPTDDSPGRGVPHWGTCPHARAFARPLGREPHGG